MSQNAICISASPGYGFGLISYLNAQQHFGTDADWEIAYDGFTQEEREKITDAYKGSFNVYWTPITQLMETVVDRRSDQSAKLEKFWLAYWLMAEKVLNEEKYKAVAVTQADQFTFVNLDLLFKLARGGNLVSAEFDGHGQPSMSLPWGDDKAIWDRSQCPIFDNLQIFGKEWAGMPRLIVEYQCEDAFKGEANHSVIALNRAAAAIGSVEKSISLAGQQWSCDASWGFRKFGLSEDGDQVFDYAAHGQYGVNICGWHARWWQDGRVAGEWSSNRKGIMERQEDPVHIERMDTLEHNINFVRAFQGRFYHMKPELCIYEGGTEPIARPRP